MGCQIFNVLSLLSNPNPNGNFYFCPVYNYVLYTFGYSFVENFCVNFCVTNSTVTVTR